MIDNSENAVPAGTSNHVDAEQNGQSRSADGVWAGL